MAKLTTQEKSQRQVQVGKVHQIQPQKRGPRCRISANGTTSAERFRFGAREKVNVTRKSRKSRSRSKNRPRKSIEAPFKSSLDIKALKLEKSNKTLKEKNRTLKKTLRERDSDLRQLNSQLKRKETEIEALNELFSELKQVLEKKDRIIRRLRERGQRIESLREPKQTNQVDQSGESVLAQFIMRIRQRESDSLRLASQEEASGKAN